MRSTRLCSFRSRRHHKSADRLLLEAVLSRKYYLRNIDYLDFPTDEEHVVRAPAVMLRWIYCYSAIMAADSECE